jgi:mono/diheme cytochrome c family protein
MGCSNNNPQGIASAVESSAASPPDGAKLFKSKCAQCHKCDKDAGGPALNGTRQNWPDKKLFYEFVRNSQEVIKTNAYAKALYKKWKNTNMPANPGLTNKEIDAIMNWCSSATQ